MGEPTTLGLVFDEPDRLASAVTRLREAGHQVVDVHTPFPVPGVADALGLPPSRLGFAAAIGGLGGGCAALGYQVWAHASDWPMDLGGKSDLALPALIPVTFELTILGAALLTFAALLWRSRLRPRWDVRGQGQPLPEVTGDRFVIVARSPDAAALRATCEAVAPSEVIDLIDLGEGT